MNLTYLIYQAERRRSAAEQRAEDARRGEFVMTLTRLLHGRRVNPAAAVAATAAATATPAQALAVPRPRVAAQCESHAAC
jgi:hypothetical protein